MGCDVDEETGWGVKGCRCRQRDTRGGGGGRRRRDTRDGGGRRRPHDVVVVVGFDTMWGGRPRPRPHHNVVVVDATWGDVVVDLVDVAWAWGSTTSLSTWQGGGL